MNIHDAALFALDAYNRATAPEDLAEPFGAEVIFDRTSGQFAAVAYYLESSNEVVVAYRGTDNPILDGATSYPIGAGQYDWAASQADQAFRFFSDLQILLADPNQKGHSSSLVFTGHSLGGGLAGLVASINELPAFVYDAMPFTEAANKIPSDINGPLGSNYHYWKYLAFPDGNVHAPSFALIQSAAIQGELLAALRWGEPFDFIGGITVTDGVEAERIVQNEIKAGTLTNQLDMHGQALLMIAMHGGLVQSDQRVTGGNVIYKHLFDSALSTRLGFADSEAMRQILAYTADDNSPRVLDGLFFDMDLLGGILLEQEAHGGPANRYADALGKLSLAHAVQTALPSGDDLSVGLICHTNGTANVDLTGVHNANDTIHLFLQSISDVLQGQLFEISTEGLSNLAVAWSGYGGSAYLQPGGALFFGSEYVDDVYGSDENDVIISMGSNATYFDNIWGGGGSDVIYASAGADTIYDGSDNDRSHGSGGNDTFHGGTGSDALFGDAGNDTFHLGEAVEGDVDYVNGGTNTTAGDTLQMSVGATYRLDASGAAAIRSQIVANGFAAPTGHGVGIEMAVGDAFVQGVETIKASAGENEIVAGTNAGLLSAGALVYDFTAGGNDKLVADGSAQASVILSGDAGRSKLAMAGATAVSFFGVDVVELSVAGDTVTVDKSHLGTQTVTIHGGDGVNQDTLHLTSFTGPITYGQAPLIGGTNIVATGFERIHTGSGDDTFYGSDASEHWDAGGGTNTLKGSLSSDTAVTTGNLKVDYSASAAPVHLSRASGTSNTAAVTGTSSLGVGGMGYGDYLSAAGWSEIIGSTGADTLSVVGAFGTLRSNGGADYLIGWKNGDTLIGADGYAEYMAPGDGNDIIHFGTGGGDLTFDTSTRAAVIDLIDGTFVFGDQIDIVTGDFTRLYGTKYGDSIKGTDLADTIDGGSGSGYDVIYGRGGDDNITFRNGVAHGGDGEDTIKALSTNAIIFGEGGDDILEGSTGSIIYGGDDNDTITAYSNSTVHGDDGDDTITTVVNSTGITVHGGAGADSITIYGYYGYPRSTLSYAQSDAGVSLVRVAQSIVATGGHAEGDQLYGTFNVVGSSFDDVFDLASIDTGSLHAGDGNDTITLHGGGGTAYGEGGDDTITLTARGQSGSGGLGNDTFHGHGAMYGDGGDDEFFLEYGEYYPGAGSWATVKVGGTVRGGIGSNTIHGGQGNDTIYMDEGSDTFIFSALGGRDTIFGAGSDDQIVLDGITGFSALTDVQAALQTVGSSTELRFSGDTHKLVFSGMSIDQVLGLDWAFT